jgi:hypothetical protein
MPLFVTYGELAEIGKATASRLLENATDLSEKTVFLSHSSKDDSLVPGVVKILENNGGRVYVDKRDPTLPKDDFVEVAAHLRSAVRSCRKFVLFVTPNSKDSIWIPWELGLGDGVHTARSVALFPSAPTSTEQGWSEQEYLGLYQRIVWGHFANSKDEWLVADHRNNTATKLNEWLMR